MKVFWRSESLTSAFFFFFFFDRSKASLNKTLSLKHNSSRDAAPLAIMLLLSGGRVAASRALLRSSLRKLSALFGQESSASTSSSIGIEHGATSPSTASSSSSSMSPTFTSLSAPHRRALFTNSSDSSSIESNLISSKHPTEETESHACVPEGETIAEEEGIVVEGDGSSTPKRNKKATPPLRPPRPSFDPLRTADALWPQSNAQRRVGQRVHRALQAILYQPRSSTLPESVSARLLGSSCGLALAGARASPDGKSVFVLYDCSPGMEEEARSALRAAAGPLRSAVSRVAGFKKVPKLVFVRDGEGGAGGGGRREKEGRGGGKGGGGNEALPGQRKERSGGPVAEIEAEMARLGLLGGGAEAQEEAEAEAGQQGEQEVKGSRR